MEELPNLSSDSGWLTIWSDIKNGGLPLFIFLTLVILWSNRKHISDLFNYIFTLLKLKTTSKVKHYTKKDIMNHQVFKDLDFWISTGVKSIHFNNISNQWQKKFKHTETEDYLKAKEDIAKDLLTIKYQSIKDFLNKFINENDFDYSDAELIKKEIASRMARCKIDEHIKMIEAGIPEMFLAKYSVFEQISEEVLYNYNMLVLDEKTFDLDTPSRIYLILNALDSYLTDVFNNISQTVISINGDLNGEEYKGHIIGEKKNKILQPPHPTFVMPAREKLNSIMSEFSASRSYLLRYYNDSCGVQKHSCVYEVCDKGITSELENLQSVPTANDGDLIKLLKNGTIIATDISKFNNYVAEKISKRGIDAVIMVPILEDGNLIGSLVLDYVSLEEFQTKVDVNNIDKNLLKYAKVLKPYITYPNDFIFE